MEVGDSSSRLLVRERGGALIDRTELANQFTVAVRKTALIALIPLVLVGVSWLMYTTPGGESPAPGSGDISPAMLAIYGVMALSPLVSVAVVRRMARKGCRDAAASGSRTMPFAANAVTESGLWEISALMGFVAFFMGSSWAVFAAFLVFSYIGQAFSFPRWSAWTALADELDMLSVGAAAAPRR